MDAIFFYLVSLVIAVAAFAVILSRQPITSVLSLLATMGGLACLFINLGAYFVAALQLLLYAGAVLVLFVFVIMLLNLQPDALARLRIFTLGGVGLVAAGLLLYRLLRIFTPLSEPSAITATAEPAGTVAEIGRLLFARYLLPFELTSFIILAAIVAAVTLAKQHSSK